MKLLQYLFILILFLAVVTLGIATFFEQKIEQIFIDKVNAYFSTELLVNDDISFSLFQHFPYASLTFNKVELRESLKNSKRNVLEADKLSFLFGLQDLFSDNYHIRKISMADGQLVLRNFHGNKSNYKVFANQNNDETQEDVDLNLEEAILNNFKVRYFNEVTDQEAHLIVEKGILSGSFGSEIIDLESAANLHVEEFYLGDVNYLPNKKFNFKIGFNVDFPNQTYQFQKSRFELAENAFILDGTIKGMEVGTQYQLQLNSEKLEVENLLTLLSETWNIPMEGLNTSGKSEIEASLTGNYTATQQPALNVRFTWEDGKLSHDKLDYPLKNIQLTGFYSNGSQRNRSTSVIDLKRINFDLAGEPISSKIRFKNFEDLDLELETNGNLELKTFRTIFEDWDIDRLSGVLELKNLLIKGKLAELKNSPSYTNASTAGKLVVNDIAFKFNNEWVDKISGEVSLLNESVKLDPLAIALSKSDFSISGNVLKGSNLLFQALSGDSINLTQPIQLELDLNSELLDIEELIQFVNTENPKTLEDSTLKNTNDSPLISINSQKYAVGKIGININKIKRRKLIVNDIEGDLTFSDREFQIQQLLFEGFGGKTELRGDFIIDKTHSLIVKLFADCKNLSFHQFLEDFENFGQDYFTDKNIDGSLNTKMYIKAFFDKKLELEQEKLKVVADLEVLNGQINNFEPLNAMSKFVKLSDLENVRFSKIENQIEISNRKIRIPAMYINSNVAKLTFSGIHTFDNRMLYYTKLNLLNLLTNKFRNKNKGLEQSKGKKGFINLFLTMTGTTDNPKIEYMKKKRVKTKFEYDTQLPKTDLDKILEENFSLGRGKLPETFNVPTGVDTMGFDLIQWSDSTLLK